MCINVCIDIGISSSSYYLIPSELLNVLAAFFRLNLYFLYSFNSIIDDNNDDDDRHDDVSLRN